MKKILLGYILIICISLYGCYNNGKNKEGTEIKEVSNITTESIKSTETKAPELLNVPLEISDTVDGLKVTITKIENDELLKIYITYENNTGHPINPCESLCKIVDNEGNQQEYNSDINDMLYDDLENGVKKESVLNFKAIEGKTFNLVLNVDYEEYRVNNIVLP